MSSQLIFRMRVVQFVFIVFIVIGIGYSFAALDTVSGPICLMMGISCFTLLWTIEIAVVRVLLAIERLAKIFVWLQERAAGPG